MSAAASHRATVDDRRRAVRESLHSAAMEGLPVSEAARTDSEEYVAGVITSAEVVARARARYGLDRARDRRPLPRPRDRHLVQLGGCPDLARAR